MLHTKFVSMFMICLHTKSHMLRSNNISVITIKLKAKYRFCVPYLYGAQISTVAKLPYYVVVLH